MENDVKELARRYRKNSKIAAWVLAIVVAIIGIVLVSLGIYFIVTNYNTNTTMLIVGIVMCSLAAIDLYICIKFLIHTYKSMKMIPDRVAAAKYMKINGIRK